VLPYTYAGNFTGSGTVAVGLAQPVSPATNSAVFTGGGTNGSLIARNGVLSITPTSTATWGDFNNSVTAVADVNGTNATLNLGPGVTLNSKYIVVGGSGTTANLTNNNSGTGGPGGAATLNINLASNHVTAQTMIIGALTAPNAANDETVNLGGSGSNPTLELTGTTFSQWGATAAGNSGTLGGTSIALALAPSNNTGGNTNGARLNALLGSPDPKPVKQIVQGQPRMVVPAPPPQAAPKPYTVDAIRGAKRTEETIK
jgi:hypothetical protein